MEKFDVIYDQAKWDECDDFLIPIDVNMNPRNEILKNPS